MKQDQLLKLGLYGTAIGDALGQGYLQYKHDSLDMYKGIYHTPAGTWSDDTSISLVFMDNLLQNNDYHMIMDSLINWHQYGLYTPYYKAFDVGQSTKDAINLYQNDRHHYWENIKEMLSDQDNGNGALMYMLPISIILNDQNDNDNQSSKLKIFQRVIQLSQLTKHSYRSTLACLIYFNLLTLIINSKNYSNNYLQQAVNNAFKLIHNYNLTTLINEQNYFEPLLTASFYQKPLSQLSASGYVIDTLFCVWNILHQTTKFNNAINLAVNLNGDVDTIAGLIGGIIAIINQNIPQQWLNKLQGKNVLNFYLNKTN